MARAAPYRVASRLGFIAFDFSPTTKSPREGKGRRNRGQATKGTEGEEQNEIDGGDAAFPVGPRIDAWADAAKQEWKDAARRSAKEWNARGPISVERGEEKGTVQSGFRFGLIIEWRRNDRSFVFFFFRFRIEFFSGNTAAAPVSRRYCFQFYDDSDVDVIRYY